jgi:hypothetical protein
MAPLDVMWSMAGHHRQLFLPYRHWVKVPYTCFPAHIGRKVCWRSHLSSIYSCREGFLCSDWAISLVLALCFGINKQIIILILANMVPGPTSGEPKCYTSLAVIHLFLTNTAQLLSKSAHNSNMIDFILIQFNSCMQKTKIITSFHHWQWWIFMTTLQSTMKTRP